MMFKVECRCKQDCCWVEVNLANLTYWEYYQILNIGVCLSIMVYNCYIFSLYAIIVNVMIITCYDNNSKCYIRNFYPI